jgi:hypothetical protein
MFPRDKGRNESFSLQELETHSITRVEFFQFLT